jgi:hypothetical protein
MCSSDNQGMDEDRLKCIAGIDFGTEVTDMDFAIDGADEMTRIRDIKCYREKSKNWFEAPEINTRTSGPSVCYNGYAERMLLRYITSRVEARVEYLPL